MLPARRDPPLDSWRFPHQLEFFTPMGRTRFLRQMIFDGRGAPAEPAARPAPGAWSSSGITGSCLGHSTVLLNLLGVIVLTDPVFSTRVGPGVPPAIVGPKRYLQPALRRQDVPVPHVLLLSHAHFDHFDRWSLRRFPRDVPVVTAPGTADLLRRFRHVHELAWGESINLETPGGVLRVEACEVHHWGTRMLRDHHRGYNGYLLDRQGHSVCFGGDTAYTDAFRRLHRGVDAIDVALMPIGAYNPWIRAHCTPEQAVAMARQAGARCLVPIHHETFRLSSEPMDEPAQRIRAAFASAPERLLAVHVGETFSVPL